MQLVDSSAIWGRGAVQGTYNLIGGAVRKLLGVTAPQESGSLKGRAEIDWSDPEERRALLNELVQEARRVLATASSGDVEADPAVAEAVALLGRILVQELVPVPDPDGPDNPGDGETGQAVLELDHEVEIRRDVARERVVSVGDAPWAQVTAPPLGWLQGACECGGGAWVHHGVGGHGSQCAGRGGGAVGYRTPEGAGTGAVCASCPLRERCTPKDPDRMRRTGGERSIQWHALEPILQAARAAEKTQRVQELLSGRWKVEQGIARLMRRGLRQARYVGQAKVRYQALATALVTNLVRLTNVMTPEPAPSLAWSPA